MLSSEVSTADKVSIHAPREGCDAGRIFWSSSSFKVSIHAPREGCDQYQTTQRVRHLCFNSRTPGGVRPSASARFFCTWEVSIHAPREGCDSMVLICLKVSPMFQFTHPGRGATISTRSIRAAFAIVSIHAPREGCDDARYMAHKADYVSIHAPREGCDGHRGQSEEARVSFNSRTPGGVRQIFRQYLNRHDGFQFTHPGRGATAVRLSVIAFCSCFNSRTPGGVRR